MRIKEVLEDVHWLLQYLFITKGTKIKRFFITAYLFAYFLPSNLTHVYKEIIKDDYGMNGFVWMGY